MGRGMEIQKTKPWRRWRDFLREYLIIVVGVLTALGAQQLVERMSWAERTAETRAHLRAELHSVANEAAARLAFQGCTNDQLDQLEQALVESGDAWEAPHVYTALGLKAVIGGPKGLWESQAWLNAQADGTANHLPQDELLAFGLAYEHIARAKALSDQEESDMAFLSSLAAVRRLDIGSRAQYLQLLYRVRRNGLFITNEALIIRDRVRELKAMPGRLEEYSRSERYFYERACREFYKGTKRIDLGAPPAQAPRPPQVHGPATGAPPR